MKQLSKIYFSNKNIISRIILIISDGIATLLFAPTFFLGLILYHPLHKISQYFGERSTEWVLLSMNRFFLWGLKTFAGVRIKGSIAPEVPLNTPLLLLSNHQSMYDITLILTLLNRGNIKFVAKKELGRGIPSISIALRNMRAALIDRSKPRQSIEEIKRLGRIANNTNRSVCIFPEGTRSRDGTLRPFKSSGVRALVDTMPNAVICPVAVCGTWRILERGFWPVRYGSEVEFYVGAPLSIEQNTPDTLSVQSQEFVKSKILFSATNFSDEVTG